MLLTIIIPAYNEKVSILELLGRVISSDALHFKKEIIVVDDGSEDGTTGLLKDYPKREDIKVIHLKRHSGKASVIKAGLEIAKGNIILIQDADLEYSPEDYGKLLEPFLKEGADVVYGSRFMKRKWPSNMKPANWIANKLFTFLINLLYGGRLTDEGTAYKAFRRPVIDSISIKCSGFEFCPEVTAKLLKKRANIIEVPVSYRARKKKEGKKIGVSDSIKVLWTIIKYRFAA